MSFGCWNRSSAQQAHQQTESGTLVGSKTSKIDIHKSLLPPPSIELLILATGCSGAISEILRAMFIVWENKEL